MRAVNLIPQEQRGGGTIGARSGGAAFMVLGLLGGLAVLAVLYGLAHHRLESRRAEAARLTAQAQQVQEQAARLAPYTSFMAIREQRAQAVAQLVASRFDWSNTMGELSRVLPRNVALSAIEGTIGSATGSASAPPAPAATASAVASATPPGTTPTITLTGCAANQSIVAQTIVRLRLISGVSNVTLASSTKSSSGSSGCPKDGPVFNLQVTFNPLPSVSETSAAAGSATGGSGSGSGSGSSTSSASYTPSGGVAR